MNCIFGFTRSFSTNYVMMVSLEFLEAGFGAGAYTTAFVLGKLLPVSHKSKRWIAKIKTRSFYINKTLKYLNLT